MYCAFYGLKERPFNLSPNPAYLFLSRTHRTARDHLVYGFSEGAPFTLLTGEVGSGKTTLIRYVLEQLPEEFEVAQVMNTQVSAGELLRLVLRDFEVEPQQDKDANLALLNGFLIDRYAAGRRALLVIDEAQNLSREALEEVRMLSNLQTETAPLLQIVLAGQPELGGMLRRPELRQLAQRITVGGHLAALDGDETGEYIAHRLGVAGAASTDLFTPEAVRRIHNETGGIPRLINNICDALLLAGYADGRKSVEGADVDAAVRERRKSVCPAHIGGPGRFSCFAGGMRLARWIRKLFTGLRRPVKPGDGS